MIRLCSCHLRRKARCHQQRWLPSLRGCLGFLSCRELVDLPGPSNKGSFPRRVLGAEIPDGIIQRRRTTSWEEFLFPNINPQFCTEGGCRKPTHSPPLRYPNEYGRKQAAEITLPDSFNPSWPSFGPTIEIALSRIASIEVAVERGDGLFGLVPVAESCRDISIERSGGGPAEAGSFMFIVSALCDKRFLVVVSRCSYAYFMHDPYSEGFVVLRISDSATTVGGKKAVIRRATRWKTTMLLL